jgi:hypothetical protein
MPHILCKERARAAATTNHAGAVRFGAVHPSSTLHVHAVLMQLRHNTDNTLSWQHHYFNLTSSAWLPFLISESDHLRRKAYSSAPFFHSGAPRRTPYPIHLHDMQTTWVDARHGFSHTALRSHSNQSLRAMRESPAPDLH